MEALPPQKAVQRPAASSVAQLFWRLTLAPTARTPIDSTEPVPASLPDCEVISASPPWLTLTP